MREGKGSEAAYGGTENMTDGKERKDIGEESDGLGDGR